MNEKQTLLKKYKTYILWTTTPCSTRDSPRPSTAARPFTSAAVSQPSMIAGPHWWNDALTCCSLISPYPRDSGLANVTLQSVKRQGQAWEMEIPQFSVDGSSMNIRRSGLSPLLFMTNMQSSSGCWKVAFMVMS